MKEHPHFKTLKLDNAFELREYHQALVAKVKVPGPFEAALKKGGFLLSDYCLGHNYKKLRMPVRSPYFLSSRPDGWEVSCLLPTDYSSRNAPKPIGDDVSFEELPHRQVAVIRVHGKSHYPFLMRKSEELKMWAKHTLLNLNAHSKIVIYQNSILPFMRRNEIHFDAY